MSTVSCDQKHRELSVQKRTCSEDGSAGSLVVDSRSSLSDVFIAKPGLVKRRIKSAGPRLELGKAVENPGVVVKPSPSPPPNPLRSPMHLEDTESASNVKKYHMVVTTHDSHPLEALNLRTSISPNLHFRGLDSLLQRNLEPPSPAPNEADEGTTVIPSGSSQGRLLVLDPAVGAPAKEKISRLAEDGGRTPRIVSVKREECMKKEHAAIFVEKDKAADQHRAVAIGRSGTWSFDKRNPVNSGSADGRQLPAIRNSSVLEDAGHAETVVWHDDVLAENVEAEPNARVDSDDAFKLGLSEHLGLPTEHNPKRCILRSNSVRVGSARKREPQEGACCVSWLDIESDPKIGLISKDGIKSQRERMIEEESMEESNPRSDDIHLPDEEGPLIQRCVIVHCDEKGFGFTVGGDNPVLVEDVKLNGAAYRAGVRKHDQIVKVNGTLVLNCNHTEVVKLIKSGSYVALTLLGRQPAASSKVLDALERTSTPGATPGIQPSTPSLFVEKGKISSPLAVDHDKDLQFKAQRVATMQMMYKQALEEYERMKIEYQKNPSESLQCKLQVKLQMVRRVEGQLRAIDANHPLLASVTSSTPQSQSSDSLPPLRPSLKRPSTGLNVSSEKSESPGVVISQLPSYLHRGPKPWFPRGPHHQKSDSMPDAMCMGRDTSAGGDGTTEDADIEMVSTSGLRTPSVESSVFSSSSVCDPLLVTSQTSLETVDSNVPSSSISQQPLNISLLKPSLKVISPNQVKVVVMEDSDFTTVDDPGAFSDLMQLKHHPAHLAVFLHYLVSNSDPAAMLFYLVTESYAQGTLKEMRKWAYEIFSTFLCDQAPLKINVDEVTVTQINSTLLTRYEREEAMRNIFQSARIFAQNEINDHLTDFRSKRALGLGSLYGDRDLKDNMDRQSEMQIVESALWKHFERFMLDEDVDRSQAMAFALATFFKQVGYVNQKSGSLLERCSSFNAREKKMFKFNKSNTKKVIQTNGHQFVTQHYFTTVYCFLCQSILWGIGNQGYQCTNCEINLHKNCVDIFKDCCTSGNTLRKKKERRPPSMFDLISRKLSNNNPAAIKEAQHQHFSNEQNVVSPASVLSVHHGLPETDESDPMLRSVSSNVGNSAELEKSPDEPKSIMTSTDQSPDEDEDDDNLNALSVGLGRSESLNQKAGLRASVRRTHSDVSPDNQVLTAQRAGNTSGSSSNSNSSLSARTSDSSEGLNDLSGAPPAGVSQKSQYSDSDFDVETELPLLESVIPKELFRKLKPKEKKRQEVINELFYTERTHVRNLKVLHHIFYQPMADDPLAVLLFPNLEELVEIHCALNNELKTRKKDSPVVGDFADILVKKFSGEDGEKFKMAAAKFCEQQSHALEVLRQRQRKDQKMAAFLQDAVSNPLCRRLELKDLILTELQRLTKYPLLIESLLKYTISNTEEYDQLVKAHDCSKDLLNYVNQRVEQSENHQKLLELQRRLDRRPIENSTHPVVSEYKKLDLTRHKMIYDGMLTWRINRSKHIDHHVVLLEDILVLLQKQDERLVLRCQSGNKESGKDDSKLPHSPIIKLNNLLTRNVAVDKRAFFLVSMSETIGPQIYELAATTKDERNKWFRYITDAAEAYKAKDSVKNKRPELTIDEPHLHDAQHSTVDDRHAKTEELAKTRSTNHQADDERAESDEKRRSNENLENVGRVEVFNFEPPQLVQPNEVTVSYMEVMEKLEPVKTPLDLLKEKNQLIETTMLEKKKLLSKLFQIPFSDYDHIAEIAGEVADNKDMRELLIGLLTKADELTILINDALNETLQSTSDARSKDDGTLRPIKDSGEDDDLTPTPSPRVFTGPGTVECQAGASSHSSDYRTTHKPTGGSTIILPSSRLMSITNHLQQHLVQLLEVIVKKEAEKEHQTSKRVMHRKPQPVADAEPFDRSSPAAKTSEQGTAKVLADPPTSVNSSASPVTFPVVMEHVEVIEVETIVPKSSAGAQTVPAEDSDSYESTGVNVVTPKAEKRIESSVRKT